MSETKHTPGKWRLSKRPGCERVIIADELDDDGEYYGDMPICFATSQCVNIDEAYANARLIAAAPELLEALEEAEKTIEADIEECRDFREGFGKDGCKECKRFNECDRLIRIRKVRFVIAKAKGETE